MSTHEEAVRRALGLGTDLPTQQPSNNLREIFGLAPVEEQVVDEINPLQAFLGGAAVSALSPLGFIPGVDEKVEEFEALSEGDFWDDVGYGLGWIAGFAIPATPALKIGGLAAKGLKLAKAVDGAAELTRLGRVARGSIAGAMLGAGRDAENIDERLKNIAIEAAGMGIGDVALDAFLAAGAARFGKKVPKHIKELIEEAAEEESETLEAGSNMTIAQARAMEVVHNVDLSRSTVTTAQQNVAEALRRRSPQLSRHTVARLRSLEKKRLRARLGLEELLSGTLKPGQVKIYPGLEGDLDDMRLVLRAIPGLNVKGTQREFTSVTGAKRKVTDFIVSFDEIDDRIVSSIKEHGFAPGQEIIWKGKKRVIVKPSKNPEFAMAVNPMGGKAFPVRMTEAQLLPVASFGKIDKSINPLDEWSDFIQKHGIWPTERGFAQSFEEFAEEKGWDAVTTRRVKGFFIEKQREAIRELDPELGKVIDGLVGSSVKQVRDVHPEGEFERMASEKGMLWEFEPQGVHKDGSPRYALFIKDAKTGQRISPALKNKDAGIDWLREYKVEPEPLIGSHASSPTESVSLGGRKATVNKAALPIAEEIAGPPGGNGIVPPHTAGEHSGVYIPWQAAIVEPLAPRGTWIRKVEDVLRQNGVELPIWTKGFLPIQEQMVQFRNEFDIWVHGGKLPDGTKIKGLNKIRGGRIKSAVRREKAEKVVDLLETPKSRWKQFITENGLNDKEVQVAQELRELFDSFWDRLIKDANISLTANDYLENYFPHIRRLSQADRNKRTIRNTLDQAGLEYNNHVVEFIHEMERKGVMTKWEKDPFVVTLKYIRAGLFKSYMKDTVKQVEELIQQIPTKNTNLWLAQRSLAEYLNSVTYGAPEVYASVRAATQDVMTRLNVELDDRSVDRLINTLVTLNYGAYMGFRPGLALRNLTQMLITTLPMTGGRYLAHGIKATVGKGAKAAKQEAIESGAIIRQSIAVPFEDVVFTTATNARVKGAMRGLKTARDVASRFAQQGIGGRFTGLYTAADDFNRVVSYHAQKKKVLDALENWRGADGHGSVDMFNREAGLTQLGKSITAEFHERLIASKDPMPAVKFLSTQLSNETQWVYQLGAGPSLFSNGVGRLFGQYGTWPMWYFSHLSRGLTKGTVHDRVRFAAWTAAINAVFASTAYWSGVNLSRWTGLSSLTWMGGPFVDWFMDLRNIVQGVTPSGESTAERSIALSRLGVRDVNGNLEVDDPAKLYIGTVGHFTPGMYMLQDVIESVNALEQGDPEAALMKILNLAPAQTAGITFPEINLQ